MTTDAILVTGAFGVVGTEVVRQLASQGRRVVATDLGIPVHRKRAPLIQGMGAQVRWADLTDAAAVEALVNEIEPTVIIHLAALIPPLCYARPALARKINVEATATLVHTASALPTRPRFILASSIAVYGARNPHAFTDHIAIDTPLQARDLYGAHKIEAEDLLRSSDLTWVVLRLGGVIGPEPLWKASADVVAFQAMLPIDGRLHTVDIRDLARAFAEATTTHATREAFLIGGDQTHQVLHGDMAAAIADVMGLSGGLPPGRPGHPERDGDWFPTDWMDTTRSQEVLSFQHHSVPEMLSEVRAEVGWRRTPLKAIAPVLRLYLRHRFGSPHLVGAYADPWKEIGSRWGDPSPDQRPDDHDLPSPRSHLDADG